MTALKLIISESQIQEGVGRLAQQIQTDYHDACPEMVIVDNLLRPEALAALPGVGLAAWRGRLAGGMALGLLAICLGEVLKPLPPIP